MNNSELDEILKTNAVPERPPHYWEQFPGKVMARTHWNVRTKPEPGKETLAPWWLRFAVVGCCLAILCVWAAVGYWHQNPLTITDQDVAIAQTYLREIAPIFPNQLQTIAFDKNNSQIVLAKAANVPASTPLLLRIPETQGFRNYVTFSGQKVSVNGEVCEVLLDRRDNVLLVGQDRVWSSDQNQFAARVMGNAL